MQLHQLQPKTKSRNKKRIGRGGKRGTYSGRGQKGQSSRAGRKIRPAQRDLIQRLPKFRGFRNKSLNSKPVIINIGDLEKKLKGDIINRQTLLEAGLIKKSDKQIKILGKGDFKKSFQIENGVKVSKKLEEKLKAAGGKTA